MVKLAENPTWRDKGVSCVDSFKKSVEKNYGEIDSVELTSNFLYKCSDENLELLKSCKNIVLINGKMDENFGYAGNLTEQDKFMQDLKSAIQVAQKLGCKRVHMLSGLTTNGCSFEGLEENLKSAMKVLPSDMIICLEIISTIPNYLLRDYDKLIGFVESFSKTVLYLLYDFIFL